MLSPIEYMPEHLLFFSGNYAKLSNKEQLLSNQLKIFNKLINEVLAIKIKIKNPDNYEIKPS